MNVNKYLEPNKSLEQDKTKIGKILPQTQDFVANEILGGNVPERSEIVSFAQQIYKSL